MSQLPVTRPRRSAILVVAVCFTTIVFDGYDLVVYGTTVPSILAYEPWAVTPAQAGAIGSYALIGMLIGTLVVGTITDVIGYRKVMLLCITWFSVAMALTSLANSPEVFGALRFVAGLGLGGVVPTAIALTVEYSAPGKRQINNAIMYSGYSVGGIGAALLGVALLPEHDFRVLYLIGAAPLLVVLPVAWRYLPESVAFLLSKGRIDQARELADQYGIDYAAISAKVEQECQQSSGRWHNLRTIFSRHYIAASILFAAASFCGLLLVYGLNTWLPQIMQKAGYSLGSSLSFLLVLNAGAVVGAIGASRLADKIGVRPVVIGAFVAAAASVILLSINPPTALLFALVAVAGLGSVGTQILVNGYVATYYPDNVRATALGWSLGIGRTGAIMGPILGGLIASSALGYQWNFYMFAVVAVIGMIVIAAVPRRGGRSGQPATTTDESRPSASGSRTGN